MFTDITVWVFMFMVVLIMFAIVYYGYWPLVAYMFTALAGFCLLILFFRVVFPTEP